MKRNNVVAGEEQSNVMSEEYLMFQVGNMSISPFHTTVTVNWKPHIMETGTIFVISKSMFDAIQEGLTTLELWEMVN